jgi:hypothetical protein
MMQANVPGRCPTRSRDPTAQGAPPIQRASAEPSQSHRRQSSTREKRSQARSGGTGTGNDPVHETRRRTAQP